MISIEELWKRIGAYEGDAFHLIKGGELVYTISGDKLSHNRTHWAIYKSSFAEALRHVPLSSPADIGRTVRGGSYIFAIMMDPRVKKSDW